MGVAYKRQFGIGRLYYDFFVEDFNLLIEVNGDFWHANPEKYLEEDLLNFPGEKVMAKTLWEKDAKKKKIALDKGFKIVYVWESEILKTGNISELILNKIKDEIGKNTKSRKQIKEIRSSDKI